MKSYLDTNIDGVTGAVKSMLDTAYYVALLKSRWTLLVLLDRIGEQAYRYMLTRYYDLYGATGTVQCLLNTGHELVEVTTELAVNNHVPHSREDIIEFVILFNDMVKKHSHKLGDAL